MKPRATVVRLGIARQDVKRVRWGHVELPSRATFWQLHLAMEAALGEKATIPEFHVKHSPLGGRVFIGVPLDLDLIGAPFMDARKVRLSDHFRTPGDAATYYPRVNDQDRYAVVLEAIALKSAPPSIRTRQILAVQDHKV